MLVILLVTGLVAECNAAWLKMEFTAKIVESNMHIHPVGKDIHGTMLYRTGSHSPISYLPAPIGKTAITQFDDLISYIHVDGFDGDGKDFWNRITQYKYMPGVGDKVVFWLNEYLERDSGNINREIFITFEGPNLIQNIRELQHNIPLTKTTKAQLYLARFNQRSLPYGVKQEFLANIQEMKITEFKVPAFINLLLR